MPAELKFLEYIFTPQAIIALVIILGIVFVVKKVWPFMTALVTFFQQLMGRDENPKLGVKATPSLFVQINSLAEGLDNVTDMLNHVKYETTPNHGGSMKDAVRRIEATQTDFKQSQETLSNQMAAVMAHLNDHLPLITETLVAKELTVDTQEFEVIEEKEDGNGN